MGGEGAVLDRRGGLGGARPLGLGEQAELGAERGRVADVADRLLREGRDQADAEGARDRDVVAEASREHQLGHARARGRADARGRLRQLHLDPERPPHRPDPGPPEGDDPLRRQRGLARRPALPALRDRAGARRRVRRADRAPLPRRPSGLRVDLRGRDELPARVMKATIPVKVVGFEVGAVSQTLDARWLMAYAAGLGETDPRYYDTEAPGGPLAHPMFAACYEWTVAHPAPPGGDGRGGRAARRGWGALCGGGPCGGEAEAGVRALPRPPAPAGDEVRWSSAVPVSTQAAHVYSECARIWNPIHTDIAVARAAGLPGLILHGTATLALAVSQVIKQDLGGDPARVSELAARLTGMVRMPSTLTVRGRGRAGDVIAFDAVDERGEAVLSDGIVRG